jgi:hypothetical protein
VFAASSRLQVSRTWRVGLAKPDCSALAFNHGKGVHGLINLSLFRNGYRYAPKAKGAREKAYKGHGGTYIPSAYICRCFKPKPGVA